MVYVVVFMSKLFSILLFAFSYFFCFLSHFSSFRCVKALDRGSARLCILSKDCDNGEYVKLVQALCAESGVHLIMADHGTEIGEWCGLVKYNADATVKKAVRCSVAVVTDFGEESAALNYVLNYVNANA
jgi:small subunit ribosomal protein S12e